MNYSNMIEEKNLKKTFIVATLISTVVGTFTASINLHERIQEKRQKAKQKQLDEKQTGEIETLQKEVKRLQAGDHGDSSSSRSRSRRRSRRGGSDDEDEEFSRSTKRSRDIIEDHYDDYVSRMGSRYARGDVITENKLQAQIISLQQTVINVLQDALINDRQLSKNDVHKLVTAQQTARAGTLDALQDQYYRMRIENGTGSNRSSRLMLEGAPAVGSPIQRQRTLPAPQPQYDDAAPPLSPARRVKSLSISANDSLYCRYGEDLQLDSRRPLVVSFSGASDCRCPACGVHLDVDDTRTWVVETQDGSGRQYALNARFMIKSHLTSGKFACLICERTGDRIVVARDPQKYLEHIMEAHGIEALQGEVDCERRY